MKEGENSVSCKGALDSRELDSLLLIENLEDLSSFVFYVPIESDGNPRVKAALSIWLSLKEHKPTCKKVELGLRLERDGRVVAEGGPEVIKALRELKSMRTRIQLNEMIGSQAS